MALLSYLKRHRLHKKAVSFVFEQAKATHTPCFTILARTAPEGGVSGLAIVVAKKKVKHAHQRNICKRIARENFRLHHAQHPAMRSFTHASKNFGRNPKRLKLVFSSLSGGVSI
jgi:ribonuclease P protein component